MNVSECIPGKIYYGYHTEEHINYYFKYLGNNKWGCGAFNALHILEGNYSLYNTPAHFNTDLVEPEFVWEEGMEVIPETISKATFKRNPARCIN